MANLCRTGERHYLHERADVAIQGDIGVRTRVEKLLEIVGAHPRGSEPGKERCSCDSVAGDRDRDPRSWHPAGRKVPFFINVLPELVGIVVVIL